MADRVVKYVFRGDITGLKASLTAAGSGVKGLGDKLTAAGKDSDKFRKGMTSLGGAAGKVGLVAAAGLGAMVVATAKFDKAMSGVRAATHETAGNMEKLRAAAIKAGADTAFSASEAADGIEQLAKAGVSTKDILGGGLKGALDLAAAGSLGVGDAAEVAATALTQFKLQGQDVPHVADLLAAAAGKAQGEVSDMGMALKQGGLVAAQMGVSIEETTGTLAAFASAGLLGSDAGTSLKTMLLRLANPSKEASELMDHLGIRAYDATGKFVGMEAMAGQLQTAFKGQTQATRDAALATIFGSDAIRAASILYNQGASGIDAWTDKVNDQGFAAETAAIKLDNLAGDMEAFKGSMETLLIGGGEGSQGMFRGLVQGATDAVNALNDLPESVKGATGSLLGLVAVTGGGLWFTAKAINAVTGMRVAIEALGLSAEKSTALMGGLAKGSVILAAAWGANELAHWGDANLTFSEYAENLHKMADTGQATAAVSHLALGLDDLGDALSSAALTDNPFGMKWGAVGQIEDMDKALSKLSADDAVKAFEVIVREGKGAGLTLEQITDLFPRYTAAAEKAAAAAEKQAIGQRTVATAGGKVSSMLHEATAASDKHTGAMQKEITTAKGLVEALNALNNSNLDNRSTFRAYQAAIDDAQKALKDNGRTLDAHTEKGRANAESLDNIASSASAHAASMQKDGRAIGAVKGYLDRARASLFDQARAFGMSKAEARAYVNQVLKIPKTAKTKVVAETGQAETAIGRVRIQLGGLRDRTVTITTAHRDIRVGGFSGISANPTMNASGGHITGPGTATSDSIPAYLSNGEYVIKAAAVAKYGTHMFDRLNAMRFADGGPVQGFADGGLSSARASERRQASAAEATRRELERLRSTLKDLRSTLAEFKDSVKTSLTHDIFGNGSAGLLTQLQADTNDAYTMQSALKALVGKGISQAFLKELAASGDVNTASQLSKVSRAELGIYDRAFNERNYATGKAANYAGSRTSEQATINRLEGQIGRLNRHLSHQTKVLARLHEKVEAGARKGVGDKAREGSQRRRAGK